MKNWELESSNKLITKYICQQQYLLNVVLLYFSVKYKIDQDALQQYRSSDVQILSLRIFNFVLFLLLFVGKLIVYRASSLQDKRGARSVRPGQLIRKS